MSEKKILIVEDDLHIAELLSVHLSRAGYNVLLAQDGVQAISVAHKERPDLIILDIMLPAGGGAGVLAALKSSFKTALVPIIATSALPEDEILRKIPSFTDDIARGQIIHFAPKPIDLPTLMNCIKARLEPPEKGATPPKEGHF